jgi:hypothetical protein
VDRAVGHEPEREGAPGEDDEAHDGGELHDPQRFFAGFVNADDVGAPEIERDADGDEHRVEVDEVGMRGGVEDDWVRGMPSRQFQHVAEESDEILPCGDGADGPGEDVIEHQGADGELGEPPADGAFDDLVHPAAGEKRAAFHVHGGDRVHEEHDRENEPRRGLADGLFADAADVVGRARQVAEDDGGGSPEAHERQCTLLTTRTFILWRWLASGSCATSKMTGDSVPCIYDLRA